MTNIQAIIFDMDGVIIDSEPLHEAAQRIVFDQYRLTVPASVFADYKGMTEEAVFGHIVAAYADASVDPAVLVAAKHHVYSTLIDRLHLIPDVLPFIRQAAHQYRLGLTTSAAQHDQQRTFDRFDLHSYFEVIVTANDVVQPKPAPEPYLTTTARLGLPPEACLVIEDSTNGVLSARRAGCHVVGLTTSFGGAELIDAGAHLVVHRFDELTAHLSLETP